jgi:hypothetical protein
MLARANRRRSGRHFTWRWQTHKHNRSALPTSRATMGVHARRVFFLGFWVLMLGGLFTGESLGVSAGVLFVILQSIINSTLVWRAIVLDTKELCMMRNLLLLQAPTPL